MTTTTEQRERYLDQLVLSLRVREVPADRIRDLVDEARAHLEESGEGPEAAFGPPHAFAADLAGDPDARIRRGVLDAWGLCSGLAVAAGVVVLFETMGAVVSGTDVALRIGNVVATWRSVDLLPPSRFDRDR